MDPILRHLNESRKVLLASHVNPDGDAVGSLTAMGLALHQLGKEVTLYNESPIPAVYRFLPAASWIRDRFAVDGQDTAVILDCGDLSRIGGIAGQAARIPVILNIDHHVTNTGFGTCRMIDTDACATAEIVFRLISELGVVIDNKIAAGIYTGILTDTGSFRFSNTNRAAFAICETMVGIGVDPYSVAQRVYGTYSLGRIKLLNLALDSIELSENGRLSMMALTRDMLAETRTRPEDIDGLINYAKGIEDVRVAALIQELEDDPAESGSHRRYHVSLRSDGTVDVSAIASSFGGGGHRSAAGFSLASSLPEVKAKLIGLSENLKRYAV